MTIWISGKKRTSETAYLSLFRSLDWCGKRDLNPYVKDTRPSNVPVCQFQHCRIDLIFEGTEFHTFSLIIISCREANVKHFFQKIPIICYFIYHILIFI